jgi:isopenicillin N synthase-like dioxygenase
MKQLFVCLAVIAGILVGALPVSAQDGAGSVRGVVQMKNSNGRLTASPAAYPEENKSGTVSWKIGSSGDEKPAAGSVIQLIAWNDDALADLTQDEIDAWYMRDVLPQGRHIFETTTDAKGEYHFANVPAGRYFMVTVSRQSSKDAEKTDSAKLAKELKRYLPSWDMYDLFVIGPRFYTVQQVDVQAGKESKANHMFDGSFQMVESDAMADWWQHQHDWQLKHQK